MASQKIRYSDRSEGYVSPMGGPKSLNPAANKVLVEVLKNTLVSQNQGDVAKKLGVSQSFISEIVSGKKGAGIKILTGLLEHYPEKFGQIVSRAVTHEDIWRFVAASDGFDPEKPEVEEVYARVVRSALRMASGIAKDELLSRAAADPGLLMVADSATGYRK